MLWYLPRKYRPPILFKALICIELPFTIAVLALFGIASPNLYRTRLWQDGADNGFNSSPDQMVYVLANYKPYTTPKVWSQFLTSYNLVISVLSMFFLLVKAPLFLVNVFYPPLSVLVHTALVILYSISMAYQVSPDTTDPDHMQTGAPWYITKNCNVAKYSSNIGYCKQAKSAFACTVILDAIFLFYLGFSIFSCFPTEEIRKKQQERLERRHTLASLKAMKSPLYQYPMSPTTPGGYSGFPAMTPRTQAFNSLNGSSDLPLRNDFNAPPPSSSPPVPAETPNNVPQMYFPPPPKKASK